MNVVCFVVYLVNCRNYGSVVVVFDVWFSVSGVVKVLFGVVMSYVFEEGLSRLLYCCWWIVWLGVILLLGEFLRNWNFWFVSFLFLVFWYLFGIGILCFILFVIFSVYFCVVIWWLIGNCLVLLNIFCLISVLFV